MLNLDTREALIHELADRFDWQPAELSDRIQPQSWRRVARAFLKWDTLIERGTEAYVHADPTRAGRGLVKAQSALAAINRRVDQAERELLRLLRYPLPDHLTRPRDPLEPRSLDYMVPLLEQESDRLGARLAAIEHGSD